MKSNAVVCAVITLALAGMASMAAQQYVEPPTPIETETKAIEDHTLGEGLARGCANIVLGWIELPKNITYYSVEWPVVGLIPGVLEGAGMTGIRVAGGLIDLVTIGYLPPGRTVYDTMVAPMMPWEGPWLPEEVGSDKME